MIEVPQEDPRPLWLIDKQIEGTGLNTLTVDGVPYIYTLVRPKVLNPNFPYAVGVGSKTELYISSDVLPEDRETILAHEIRENYSYPLLMEEERCTAALKEELREVKLLRNPGQFKQYIERRTEYFDILVRYYEAPEHAAMVSPQFKEGLEIASGFIKHITRNLKKY